MVTLLGVWSVKNHRANTMKVLLRSFVNYAAAIIILCWELSILGVNVSTIVASMGIVALIVGFGANSLIEDMITGLFMVFENQFNVGDIIEVDGFRGVVSEIGIRATSITDSGRNTKIINNSRMKNILNRSNVKSIAVSDIVFPYDADIVEMEKKIPKISAELVNKKPEIFSKEPAYAGVQSISRDAITLRFTASVQEENLYQAIREMNREYFIGLK